MRVGRALGLGVWAALLVLTAISCVTPPKAAAPPMPVVASPTLEAPPAIATGSRAGLWVTLEPPDLWALVTTAEKQYPPVEFDHPYPGKVVLIEGASQEALHVLCPLPGAILGCAVPKRDGVSTIAIADEKTIRTWGWTRGLILRHEIAHLNGWPPNHLGAR